MKPISGAAPRVETYRIVDNDLFADHAQQATDAVHHIEFAQFANRRLNFRLECDVRNENETSVRAVALLLGDANADVVAREHAGHCVQHARTVGDIEAEQVLE